MTLVHKPSKIQELFEPQEHQQSNYEKLKHQRFNIQNNNFIIVITRERNNYSKNIVQFLIYGNICKIKILKILYTDE